MERQDRIAAMGAWFITAAGGRLGPLSVVAGDASFRRYFRATHILGDISRSVVLCDAPPETEKNAEFVAIANAFHRAGVRVPRVLASDLAQGFLALEDLGDALLLPALDAQSVDALYADALDMLVTLATADLGELTLAPYDRATLRGEMRLFPEWFVQSLLQMEISERFEEVFAAFEHALCERALGQLQVPVHRDFHARNLMLLDEGGLATIDFQDALRGPLSYDLVSLLRDCYCRWPDAQVRDWALVHRNRLAAAGLAVPSEREFLCDMDWMGLQRHIKVLGIFARLSLRDGKDAYLGDLPRVIAYVRDVLAVYPHIPALADFAAYFDEELMPRVRTQAWYIESASEGNHS